MIEHSQSGFTYLVEHIRNGEVIDRETVHNLMPVEGINHMLSATLKGATQVTTWYLLPYEGNYTPVSTDTAATFPASATECTAYADSTRFALTLGTASGGVIDNSAAKTEITFNASKTIYGGAISSVGTKSATSGVLLSAVKFSSAKVVASGDILRITAGITITSA